MPLPRRVHHNWNRSRVKEAVRLYAIAGSTDLKDDMSLATSVAEALVGGATFIQLRNRDASTIELIKDARAIAPICRIANVPLVINDDIEAAKATEVDGVHIGQSDISCQSVRSTLGANAIIGVTVSDVEQAKDAELSGATYISVGPVFKNVDRNNHSQVSIEMLKRICDAVSIPVVAYGGITPSNVIDLSGTGISGIASITGVFDQDDIERSTRDLLIAEEKIFSEEL